MFKLNKKFFVLPVLICLMLATMCTFGFAGCSTEKLTVTFDANGGYFIVNGEKQQEFKVEVNPGEKLDTTSLVLPKRDSTLESDYEFNEWSYNISDNAITKSMTITADWTKSDRYYTVTFNANGGTFDENVSIITNDKCKYNDAIVQPAVPTRASDDTYQYTFTGYNTTVSKKVTGSVTYTAQWDKKYKDYTITLNGNGGQISNGTELVDSYAIGNLHFGDQIKSLDAGQYTAPASTTAGKIYVFDGWYDAQEGGNQIKTVPNHNATLYARWKEETQKFTITFSAGAGEFQNGAKTVTWTADYGTTIVYPYTSNVPKLEKTNTTIYAYNGFDIGNGDTVTKDATYTAQYSETTRYYTVTFVAGSCENQTGYFGNTTDTKIVQQYEYNKVITTPEVTPIMLATEKRTYTFAGYENFEADTQVTGDVTYTAQWNATDRLYNVTFKAGTGATFTNNQSSIVKSIAYGTLVTAPDEKPVKSQDKQYTYEFVNYGNLTENTAVTGEMEFVATYQPILREYEVTFYAGDNAYFAIVDEDTEVTTNVSSITQKVEYGKTPTAPTIKPIRRSDTFAEYTFNSWGTLNAVNGESDTLSYTATYSKSVREYTVSFFKNKTDTQAFYTAKFNADEKGKPSLSASQYEALEQACATEGISLKDEDGFAGQWSFILRNANETFNFYDNNIYSYGDGTENNPHLINDLSSFNAMMNKLDKSYSEYATATADVKSAILSTATDTYYKMIADVDFTGYTGNSRNWFIGHLDAQKSDTENYAIKGMTDTMFSNAWGAMFKKIWNAEISNLDIILGESIVSFGDTAYGDKVTFKNVNVRNADGCTTLLTAGDTNESAYLCFSIADALVYEDCTNYANYISSAYFGIFFGGYTGTNNTVTTGRTLTFTRCVNYGDVISSNWVGMLMGNPCARNFYYSETGDNTDSQNAINITGCVNYGSITATQCGGVVGATGKGFNSQQVQALNSLVTLGTKDGKTGSFNTITKLNGSLTTGDKFTLTNSSNYSAGTYEITLMKYAVASDGSTVRVNYSYSITLGNDATSITFGDCYDFIDLNSYNALTNKVTLTDWKTTEGYQDIKYAFDQTNHYIVFDFAEFGAGTDYTLSPKGYSAYITYYSNNELVGVQIVNSNNYAYSRA